MYYAHLQNRGVLAVSGPDAITFLQGLITNDIRKAEGGKLVYAALLTPQGKFLHDFFLMSQAGRILIDTEKHRLDELKQRLSLYKLRSQVTIEVTADMGVVAVWGGEHANIMPDPRLHVLGGRIIGNMEESLAWCKAQGFLLAGEQEYDRHRIECAVPDGSRDMIPDKSFLLEFGIDELNGIDFAKGCYVGQEVTARTKYRGQVRKFLYRVIASVELPQAGTPVLLGDVEAGELRSHAGLMGLAILRSELVEKAHAEVLQLTAGGARIVANVPPWFTQAAQAGQK